MSIVANQQKAFAAQALDASRRLADALANLSEAERFAILTRVAYTARVPVDITYWAEHGDERQVYAFLYDVPSGSEPYSFQTHSGCEARLTHLPGEEPHE